MKKLILSILFISLFSLYSQAQTSIPDAAFEAKLIQLGIDSDGMINGVISSADAAGVSSLIIDNSNISDLTGIDSFSNLSYLDCSFNQLISLDLSNNTNLTNLLCHSNQLTNLAVSNNTNLSVLHCYTNQLSNLDLSNNTGLTNLNCSFNHLNSIDLSNSPSLKYLNCNSDSLTSLDVSNNPSLEQLRLTNNLLTNIDLSSNLNLTRLTCDDNQLNSLDISNNSDLVHLSCNNNELNSLDISNNIDLTGLYCINNQLTSLDISNNSVLERLSCHENQLASLNTFNNPILVNLGCDNNQLTRLNTSNNPSLTDLACAFNNLTSLNTSNNPNLVYLGCNHNLLTSLNTSNNPNLEYLYCNHNQLTNLELSNNLSLVDLFFHNNYLKHINVKNNSIVKFFSDSNLIDLIICVNDSNAASIDPFWFKAPTATYTETCPNNTLVGSVKSDTNNNCTTDASEPIVRNTIIKIANSTDTIYTIPNVFGKYAVGLDPGAYTISITSPYSYLNPCNPLQTTTIDSINDLDTINWALQTSHYCPFLHASISAPLLRMTGGGSFYTINYCNHGTLAAYGAYIEVEIDSFLNVLSTGLPIMSQVGNLYTFNLDTLDIGECGTFDINVIVDTSAQIGQVHCSEVHIYPDSSCNNSWTGPIIETEGICNNDTIIFSLKNNGNPMNSSRNYVVIEDNLVMFTNPFTLGSGANATVEVVAQPGKFYRIQAEQAIGFPAILGPPIAYSNIQNCNQSSSDLGALLQYYNGNTAPWIDTDCQANIAAYDPNDKATQQIGYGNKHYINRANPLDYKVRFQNTGNDTAFHVTILDTISPYLDLSTLDMKGGSHNYTWQIIDGRTLRIDFPNIKLVDSIANEPLSHGFIRYEIQQNPNLPLETLINNQAAIYFDYNPPIFTNTTFHTIGEDFIITSIKNIWVEEAQVQLYPNPTSGLINIEQLESIDIKIKAIDNLGRVVLQQNTSNKQTTLDLKALPQGIYYINIQQEHKISTYKVVKY